jgi:hypothetical protein
MSTLQPQRLAQSLLLFAIAPALFACSKAKFSATKVEPLQPIKQTNSPRPLPPAPITSPTVPRDNSGQTTTPVPRPQEIPQAPVSDCKDYEYTHAPYKGPKAVNVWIVMDGSKSNRQERYKQLSGMIEMYEATIAREIPIKLAVITGHSKQSSDSAINGNAFYKQSNDPYVLHFGYGSSNRGQMLKFLEQKILGMRTDNSSGVSDGGELLTVNLLAALKNPEAMATVGQGDVLNIHFLGDENDICTIGQVEDYDKITVQGKRISREEYARQLNCGAMNVTNGGNGYSQVLADAITQIQQSGRARIHTSGFLYTGENPIPRGSATDENEIGRGMVDLIEVTGGKTFDLAGLFTNNGTVNSVAVSAAGATVMEDINKASEMYFRHQLKTASGEPMDLTRMDTRRSQVAVVDSNGRAMPVQYRAGTNGYIQVTSQIPGDVQKIRVSYCNK